MEIVFVGRCEVLLELFFFSFGREAHRSENFVNSLKTADFSLSTLLSQCLYLRGRSGFLEIVFVGGCEVLVCL